ncbi:MAG TPA: hypothetical protein DEG17_00980 [Cyanobacteria bacterium UBA11149]|nr:hypothetical protein [Cyanobacteria bacterium UBA11367]HBE59085.1 hypothetical protein [Cyanobacteria bacterium UBA11366]HBK64129.1 hypothetical protein [Cyanobacteria bacterium UBA11166]HBR72765.1 hypothetical protein [Cyanobacteria bacterium UBA11159]HBS67943.1 hypothetical protein [Cyanobacteria bacterium UBA11153]HBW87487.1 hypothetical protein [Cyanobacteria bacterium UBA11149]HCA94051.1 hypothetical protein [Cyanobacteria bacterium UBA9226]
MQAFEVMGTIDEKGQLILDRHLNIHTSRRVKVIVLVNSEDESEFDPDDTPVAEIKASLRRGLQQVKAGETRPISELWDRIDD